MGIVGGGIRGRLFAEALATRSDVELIGVADPSSEKLGWVGRLPVFPDHEALLDSRHVDGLIIATPDFAHFGALAAAARRGIPALVEKPLTTDLAEAEELQRLTRGVEVMVGFENRWNPRVRAIHAALATAGPVGWQSIELSNTMDVPLRMLSAWSARSSPAWFLLPHIVDLAMWVADDQIVTIEAATGEGLLRARGVNTIDWVQAFVRFTGGSSCTLTSSWVLPDQTKPIVEFHYTANAARAAVRADVIRGISDVVTPDDEHGALVEDPRMRDGVELSAPAAMVHEFVDRLIAGQPLGPGIEHGAAVTRTIAAILGSAEAGRAVNL